ncbi:precorrin-6y C5,15-methyltransferase (decarboxylating) subunit CbiE [Pseudorhodobacter sp.]|uniref:precorrin-6y C5,15-methyltransferase (decarboxylating) subunit CbiE n=1 Tax=Pseudorhodobacter sp. TaxID=1934400 RepID=UPI002AFF5F92|nr:precorrin-6y C5,15-methyltransferase (decarboxylating) subunit CbiE [Pseudorhodobacter sp.]
MAKPWLSFIGMSDDSADNLPAASRAALDAATVVFGGPRHLALADVGERGRPWPVPFSIDLVLAQRGKPTAVLASGDPFWFGVGGSLSDHLDPGEWQSFAAPSTFSLVAANLGWRLEETSCHGLHAAAFARLRPALAPNGRLICLLRDGTAPALLASWLTGQGAGDARLWVMQAMGGADQRVYQTTASGFDLTGISAPVAVAIALPRDIGLPRCAGLPDDSFAHDGQITKRPIRALTVSALAPRPGEMLWDIGAGSGSISVEWCLAGGQATAFEQKPSRAANIRRNAQDFGLTHRLTIVEGDSHTLLAGRAAPDAVFVGGGGTVALFDKLFALLPAGTRLVANGVTLETEALLTSLHASCGGSLLRIETAQAEPLGRMRGWQSARPVVQWNVTL